MLNWVRDQAEKEADLQQYVPHLQSNTILRLLQQVIPFFPLWKSLCSHIYFDTKILFVVIHRLHRYIRVLSSPVWPLWFRLWMPSSWNAPLLMLLGTVICRYLQQQACEQLINKLLVMFWMLHPLLNELVSDLGPHRSHHSHAELWVWFELFYQRGFPSWPFSTENALWANQEPADCHVCIIGQSYPGHQACLHPGELTCLSLWTLLLPNFLINDV